MTKIPENVRDYLSQIGTRGGAAGKGEAKRRGDSDYYAKLGRAAARARWSKKQENAS